MKRGSRSFGRIMATHLSNDQKNEEDWNWTPRGDVTLRVASPSTLISSDPNWPGFFWITSLLYGTDARREGRKKERRVRMDRKRSEPAQHAWS
jgi:hypothetical protein